MDVRAEFSLDPGIVYLNHAAVAPWPRRTAEAVQRFAAENAQWGARGYRHWLGVEQQLREQLRFLLNAPHIEDIALLKNTSEGLSVVAHGLEWRAGDNIVTSDEEFPSNRIVWDSLRDRGVTLREVPLRGTDPEAALVAAMDERTRLLAVSSVQYASGRRLNLARLGTACHARGTLFCVDAIQSLGAVPVDVQAAGADFLAADGHKWLLGPEGLAVFWCRAELRERLQLHQYGWHMVEHAGDYDRRDWQPARSARRFECGSPNMLGIHALHASLSLLLEVGMENIARRVLDNAGFLLEALRRLPQLEVMTPRVEAQRAGIITVRRRQADPAALWQHLTTQGVICATRGGGIRFSPHFYNHHDELQRVVELIAGYRS